MRYSPSTYRKIAIGELVIGIVFLGTTGVQFVVDGNSKGAVGTVIGVLAVAIGVRMWMRAMRAANDERAAAAAASGRKRRGHRRDRSGR